MKRFWHYMKENEKTETVNHCIFVDCETHRRRGPRGTTQYPLWFGWACSVKRKGNGQWATPVWKRFEDADDFWLWAMCLIKKKSRCWLWCHNSNFDYPVLDAFRKLPALGFSLEGLIIDGPPTVVRYEHKNKTLMLCDTLNIWRMSLRKMAKLVGLEKYEMPKKKEGKEANDRYCRRDVEIICKAICEWTDFLRANDLGGFCPTIAAQAMRTFRHKFMHEKILVEASDISLALARSCYHGGRCEAHYIGAVDEPVYSVDVNSMYPYVMASYAMPVRLRGISRWVQKRQLAALLHKYSICAHVSLCTDEPAYPYRAEGKLTFPVGRFEAYLTSPEIEHAMHCGHLSDVHLCATYDKSFALRDFAETLYRYKEDASRAGDTVRAEQFKLLLNSFYGKFGQSGRHWVQIGAADPNNFLIRPDVNAQTGKITYIREFGGISSVRSDDPESMESHPAIAATITAHARMILWTLIKKMPSKAYLYCDTDGLLVTKEGFEILRDLVADHVLGKLKHVATYSDCVINGCKDYLLDGEQKLKGIRKEAVRTDDGKYRQIKWFGLAGLLRANSIHMPLTIPITKTLTRTYNKGIVGADGFVTPHQYCSCCRGPK